MKHPFPRYAAKPLSRPAIAALRRIAAAALALAGSGWIVWQAAANHAAAHSALNEAGRRHAAATEALRIIDDPAFRSRLAAFAALEARGLIGSERRPEWTALLDRMTISDTPLALTYELSPAQPEQAARATDSAADDGPRLRRSLLRLNMELLHEGDLIAVLDELAQRIGAIVRIRGCELARKANGEADASRAALAASCRLELVTVAGGGRSR